MKRIFKNIPKFGETSAKNNKKREESMQLLPGSFVVVISAVIIGVAFGFVLQRGRFCVNTAFRDIIFINDFTLFRAYLLSVVIAIIGANLLEDMHWLGGDAYGPFTLSREVFAPVANIVGGYIFGLGMVLAGGCGSGILYRVGEGLTASMVAVLGFGLAIITTTKGVLRPVYLLLRSFKVGIHAPDGSINYAFSLPDLFGGGLAAIWITIAVITVVAGIVIVKGQPFQKGPAKGYKWSVAGTLVGLMVVAAWWTSGVYGRDPRGLSFTGPLGEAFLAVINRSSGSPRQMFDFFGLNITWSAIYILVVPVGALLSSKALKEFKLKVPNAAELMTVFGGSLLMGFGAATAGG